MFSFVYCKLGKHEICILCVNVHIQIYAKNNIYLVHNNAKSTFNLLNNVSNIVTDIFHVFSPAPKKSQHGSFRKKICICEGDIFSNIPRSALNYCSLIFLSIHQASMETQYPHSMIYHYDIHVFISDVILPHCGSARRRFQPLNGRVTSFSVCVFDIS